MLTAIHQVQERVSPFYHRGARWWSDWPDFHQEPVVKLRDEPGLLHCPSSAFGPKVSFPPVQNGVLHCSRALGKERRAPGVKVRCEPGL